MGTSFNPKGPAGFWPPEISFVPFVGKQYDSGIEDCRVLILGEAHYSPSAEGRERPSRRFTRSVFRDCERSTSGRAWGTFFRRCDQILSRNVSPSDAEAAAGWQHAAFANFVQSFAGTAARQRPTQEQWAHARRVFPILLGVLKPDVVLVLGKQLWEELPHIGQNLHTIPAARRGRDVWLMPFEGGSSLVTWVYHPSWPNDTPDTYVQVFGALLKHAKALKGQSREHRPERNRIS